MTILIFLLGFVLGSLYSWAIMRHYGSKVILSDVKQDIVSFVEEKKRQMLGSIQILKDELFSTEKPNKEIRENEVVYTPYGSF